MCLCILTRACVCVYNFFLWTQYVCVCLYVHISFTLASRKGKASASAYPVSLPPPWCPPQPFVHTGHSESLWKNFHKLLSLWPLDWLSLFNSIHVLETFLATTAKRNSTYRRMLVEVATALPFPLTERCIFQQHPGAVFSFSCVPGQC